MSDLRKNITHTPLRSRIAHLAVAAAIAGGLAGGILAEAAPANAAVPGTFNSLIKVA